MELVAIARKGEFWNNCDANAFLHHCKDGFRVKVYFALIRDIGATSTLSVALLIPIFGTLWGSLFLNETLTPGTFIGMALILISILWITRVPDVAPFPDKQ
jgi:uncharacterized membrane protein